MLGGKKINGYIKKEEELLLKPYIHVSKIECIEGKKNTTTKDIKG